jgi:hypothetical protein
VVIPSVKPAGLGDQLAGGVGFALCWAAQAGDSFHFGNVLEQLHADREGSQRSSWFNCSARSAMALPSSGSAVGMSFMALFLLRACWHAMRRTETSVRDQACTMSRCDL